MRNTVHAFWRALIAVASVGLRLPAVLVAVWGGFYIADCLNALTAPGVPVEYRYQSEMGEMVALADAYQFDLETMQGFVQRVRIYDADGNEVASTDMIDLLFDGDVAVFRLNSPRIKVTRLEDGSLDIFKMLPVSEDEEITGGAFRLVANDAVLEYRDVNVDREPLRVALHDVGVDGAGGTFLFKSRFVAQGLRGELGGSFNDEGRLIADVSFSESEAAPLLDYARPFLDYETLGEWAYADADSILLDGNARLWMHKDAGFDVTGDMDVEMRGLTTPQTLRDASLVANVSSFGRGLYVRGALVQRGFSGSYDGTLRFGDDFRMSGALTARSATRGDVPFVLQEYIDPAVDFRDAAFDGNMDTDGEGFDFIGDLTASSATFAGETTTNVVSHVRLNQDRLMARFDQGTWAGLDYSGAVSVEFADGTLGGAFRSERGRLEPLAQHFGTDRLKGIVSVSAVIGGSLDDPRAEIYARGSGGVQVTDGPLASIGVFEARGRVDNVGLYLERLTSSSQNGALAASGSMMWSDGSLDLEVSGGGLDLSAVSDDLKGYGFLDANVRGTRDFPTADGRLEVYALEAYGRRVPQVVVDWRANDDQLVAERFAARAGTGQLSGAVIVDLNDRSINGSFSGDSVRLEEWLVPSTVGSVAVRDGRVSGTLDDPLVTASLEAGPVFVGAVEVQRVVMPVVANGERIRSTDFVAHVDDGRVTGEAEFVFETRSGRLDAELTELPLKRIPLADYSLSLDGTASGDLVLVYDETGITGGTLDAEVAGLSINETVVGQGWVTAEMAGDQITAEAQVGSLDRYVLLSGGGYNTGSRAVEGELLVYNVLLEDVIEGSAKAISAWPEDVADLFLNSKGLLNAGLTVSGNLDDPTIEVDSLVLTELQVRGRDAGAFRASGGRRAGVWTINQQVENPMWQLGDTSFTLDGTITEEGALDVQGVLANMRAEWLHTLFPAFPLVTGVVNDFTFRGSGTLTDPVGRASLEVASIGYYDGDRAVQLPLSVTLDSIEFSDQRIDLLGTAVYNGLAVGVTGDVPLSSLYEDPAGREPMAINLSLAEWSFENLARSFPVINEELSVGTVSGSASITGVWGDMQTRAEINANGEVLALDEHGTFFRDVAAKLSWQNGALNIDGSFAGETQGTGSVSLEALVPDFFKESVDMQTIGDRTTIAGNVQLNDYRLQFVLPNAESASGATVTTNNLALSGTLSAPRVSGDIGLDAVFVRLPDDFAGQGSPIIFKIDPAFDGVNVNVGQGSRLVTDQARIEFFGSGRLDGSLQNPDVSLPLTVTGGRFDLPTARVALQEGGTIIVGYRSALGTAPTARVDLNLEGHTTISARRASNEYERYDIQLLIRGNLLDEEGLNITASSDPPDLSSDQIMAVLGRKDVIENFARGGSDEYLRETLYSFGLPSATNVLTSGLAAQLGLDYIAVDYNPFDQTIVSVGKTIGKGLMIHASRQLQADPGERLKYELLLSYRLPMEDAFFSRVRLSLGLDEQVPWKVKLNWSRRF